MSSPKDLNQPEKNIPNRSPNPEDASRNSDKENQLTQEFETRFHNEKVEKFLRGFAQHPDVNYHPDKFNDPTYVAINNIFITTKSPASPLFFKATQEERSANKENNFDWTGYTGSGYGISAYEYLVANGYHGRAQLLERLARFMQEVFVNSPYMINSIKGLNQFIKIPDSGQGTRTKEKPLEIEFKESIDYRVAAMIDLYRKIVYDFEYRRYVLPRNLRWFQFYVVVKDPRYFWEPGHIQKYIYNNRGKPSINNYTINDKIPLFQFNFTRCEIDFNESFSFLDTVETSTPDTPVTNSLKIQPGNVFEHFSFPFFSLELTNINRTYSGFSSKEAYSGGNANGLGSAGGEGEASEDSDKQNLRQKLEREANNERFVNRSRLKQDAKLSDTDKNRNPTGQNGLNPEDTNRNTLAGETPDIGGQSFGSQNSGEPPQPGDIIKENLQEVSNNLQSQLKRIEESIKERYSPEFIATTLEGYASSQIFPRINQNILLGNVYGFRGIQNDLTTNSNFLEDISDAIQFFRRLGGVDQDNLEEPNIYRQSNTTIFTNVDETINYQPPEPTNLQETVTYAEPSLQSLTETVDYENPELPELNEQISFEPPEIEGTQQVLQYEPPEIQPLQENVEYEAPETQGTQQILEYEPPEIEGTQQILEYEPPEIQPLQENVEYEPPEIQGTQQILEYEPPEIEGTQQVLEYEPPEIEGTQQVLQYKPPEIEGTQQVLEYNVQDLPFIDTEKLNYESSDLPQLETDIEYEQSEQPPLENVKVYTSDQTLEQALEQENMNYENESNPQIENESLEYNPSVERTNPGSLNFEREKTEASIGEEAKIYKPSKSGQVRLTNNKIYNNVSYNETLKEASLYKNSGETEATNEFDEENQSIYNQLEITHKGITFQDVLKENVYSSNNLSTEEQSEELFNYLKNVNVYSKDNVNRIAQHCREYPNLNEFMVEDSEGRINKDK
jgi:hypothetical protein